MKQILYRLVGVVMVIGSIMTLPLCNGDCGYLLVTIPIGLAVLFGPKEMFE